MTEATNPSVLAALGLNGKLFIAQLINFSVVLFVVWRWIYKPLLAAMDKREKTIAGGLNNAEKAQQTLADVERRTEGMLNEARQTSQRMIDETRAEAVEERKKLTEETQAELERQLAEARDRLKADKQAILTSIKTEVAELIAAATQKVAGEGVKEDAQHALIQSAIRELAGEK